MIQEIFPANSRFSDGSILFTRSRKHLLCNFGRNQKSKLRAPSQVLGYDRYIDNALALIWAQDKSSCSAILSKPELGPLEIEWDIVEGNEGTNHFLNLELMVLLESDRIDYKI